MSMFCGKLGIRLGFRSTLGFALPGQLFRNSSVLVPYSVVVWRSDPFRFVFEFSLFFRGVAATVPEAYAQGFTVMCVLEMGATDLPTDLLCAHMEIGEGHWKKKEMGAFWRCENGVRA